MQVSPIPTPTTTPTPPIPFSADTPTPTTPTTTYYQISILCSKLKNYLQWMRVLLATELERLLDELIAAQSQISVEFEDDNNEDRGRKDFNYYNHT